MIHPIRFYGDPVLRRRASPVTSFDAELEVLAADMFATMYAADGVGLAAPQIGLSQRIFVALEVLPGDDEDDDDVDTAHRPGDDPLASFDSNGAASAVQGVSTELPRREHVLVNPVITKREGLQFGRDGCLSLPGLAVEECPRDLSIEVSYQDLSGAKRTLRAEGYFAHVLQHEYDHLEGIFFFDRLPAERKRQFLEEHRQELSELQREAKAYLRAERERNRPRATRGRLSVS